MERTNAMVEAEIERLDLLHSADVLLGVASKLDLNAISRDQFLDESIKCLMIGSHSGRVG